jgi:hypothetical protein
VDASPGRWRWAVAVTALAALAVRLLIVAHSRGGADLRIYTYFGRLALHGLNPFAPPHGGEFPALESDNPPLEIAVLGGVLGIHDSPTTIRVLFAISDAILILFVGLCFKRRRGWRAAFIVFYAFNPFVLVVWTGFAEDKTVAFLGIAVWIWAMDSNREWITWITTAALTAIKFVGAYAVPVLALDTWRRHRWRAFGLLAPYLALVLASYLLWFPHSVETLSRRNFRLGTNPPIHASWTILLSRIGIYAPIEAKVLTALAIVAVCALYARRRLDLRDAAVWSILAGFAFLPNSGFDRVLLFTLPFLLIIEPSARQWLIIWIYSCVAALAAYVATRGVPHLLSPIGGGLRAAFGQEATVRHVLWMNLLPAIILIFYFQEPAGNADILRPLP